MPRPKKSAARARRDGSARTHPERYRNDDPEPKISDNCPQPPEWLSELARKYWRQLSNICYEAGLLTEADTVAFAELCHCAARLEETAAILVQEGAVLTDGKGKQYRHPIAVERSQLQGTFLKLCNKFGLTPSDRNGLPVQKPEKPDHGWE